MVKVFLWHVPSICFYSVILFISSIIHLFIFLKAKLFYVLFVCLSCCNHCQKVRKSESKIFILTYLYNSIIFLYSYTFMDFFILALLYFPICLYQKHMLVILIAIHKTSQFVLYQIITLLNKRHFSISWIGPFVTDDSVNN